MERKWVQKWNLRERYPFQCNKELLIRRNIFIVIAIVFWGLLSGCYKRQRIIIEVRADSSEDSILDGLEVINEDYEAALKRCEEKLVLIGEGDSGEAADVYSFMGGIYAGYANDKEQAIYYINKAIKIHEKDKDDIGLAWDYSRLGKAYIFCDDENPEKGLEYLERAEKLCEKYEQYGLDESILMATVWSHRGDLSGKKGEYEKALESYNKAQKIYDKKQQPDAKVFLDKGHIYRDMGEYELAEEEYLKAREIYVSNDDEYFRALLDSELGYFYLQMEEYNKSIKYYIEELEICIPKNYDMEGQILAYANMAYAFSEMKDHENALDNAIAACRLLEDNVSLGIDPEGICKANLSLYYSEWTDNKAEEDFESWYKRVVLDGKDWR
jgi:tetratricopeptide (TPR) repeat protein